jgi:hypothetical protein
MPLIFLDSFSPELKKNKKKTKKKNNLFWLLSPNVMFRFVILKRVILKCNF